LNPARPSSQANHHERGSAPILGVLVLFLVPALAMVLIAAFSAVNAAADSECGSPPDEPPTTQRALALADLNPEQRTNATTIVQVADALGLPPAAARIAIAVAMQESTLRNLPDGDRDSVGLFQQRAAWGAYSQRTNPTTAATMFYTGGHAHQPGLTDIQGWPSMPLTVAAQKVQRSATPNAYAAWTTLADNVVTHLWARAPTIRQPTAQTNAHQPAPPAEQCPGSDGDGSTGPDGNTSSLPDGLVVDGTAAGQKAVRFALAQLGKPYRWGAAGPNAYDCSGLTMTAWASAGKELQHFTGAQAHAGTSVPRGLHEAVAGDLVFIPGSHGTIAAPRHVGLIIGYVQDGAARQLWIVHAPRTGQPVQVTPASRWASSIAAVRHID
jgi:cell wall-associated NlpC family hydrolase